MIGWKVSVPNRPPPSTFDLRPSNLLSYCMLEDDWLEGFSPEPMLLVGLFLVYLSLSSSWHFHRPLPKLHLSCILSCRMWDYLLLSYFHRRSSHQSITSYFHRRSSHQSQSLDWSITHLLQRRSSKCSSLLIGWNGSLGVDDEQGREIDQHALHPESRGIGSLSHLDCHCE